MTWVSQAEAARLLGVTRAQVNKLAEDVFVVNDERQVPLDDVEAYARGWRPASIDLASVRQALDADLTDATELEPAVRRFIRIRRPAWPGPRCDDWARRTAVRLTRAATR